MGTLKCALLLHPKHAQWVTYSGVYAGHARTGMFSASRNCVQIFATWGHALSCCNMRWWSWMNGTTLGLRISSRYLCAGSGSCVNENALLMQEVRGEWTIEDWKNVVWSDESRFLLQHSDGRFRIWRKEHESMDPSCLVSTVQAGGDGVMVWGIFYWHTVPFSTNWVSFKRHSLPEYRCWPYPSLYDYSVLIFWWILPAG